LFEIKNNINLATNKWAIDQHDEHNYILVLHWLGAVVLIEIVLVAILGKEVLHIHHVIGIIIRDIRHHDLIIDTNN
jgi:hypothetical protein